MKESEKLETAALLEAIYQTYGYDFRNYAGAHLRRRIRHRVKMSGLAGIPALHEKILNDKTLFEKLLFDLSINVTGMFRDPLFYRAVRQEVVPLLKTYPFVKIWHAGCATGEEVYSMAILLIEEGIYDKCQIYATDFNEKVLARAREGIYPIDNIKDYTTNYQKAGGTGSFADYYISRYDSVIMDRSLREKIVFADHNLATDSVFGEMNMIICRNVIIYFNHILRERVLRTFQDSLCLGGVLGLGSKESLRFTPGTEAFELWLNQENIYRKRYE